MDAVAQTTVAEEEIHEALASGERRRIISILQDAGDPLSLADIAIELAEREGMDGEELWERAQQLRIDLYHWHIPKLKDAGVVEYDSERAAAWASPE